jgi:hypothetical protein
VAVKAKPALAADRGVRPSAEAARQELTLDLVRRLRALVGRSGAEGATETADCLSGCAASAIEDPRVLVAYHDCLLFLLAYPQTPELHAMAGRELLRAAAEANRRVDRGGRQARAMEGSGVAWSETRAEFSFPIARWLVHKYPDHAEVDSFGDGGVPLQVMLGFCLPEMEHEILAEESGPSLEVLDDLTTAIGGSKLSWLVAQIERLPSSDAIRDHLFESLRAKIVIRPRASGLSRTLVRGLPHEPFCHGDGLIRHADPPLVMSEPLPSATRLRGLERERLIDSGRAMLAMLGRETDPISLCSPAGVEYLELGRGVSICLYWLPPGRRFPLDTHVGFMLFKNSLPVAYGGGWPFLGLCKIGINIFEPYRGGESAMLFCQVLRVYAQRFGVERFLVEPFQFGAGNPEGVDSRAFRFYYRMGFRPVDGRLARLALDEAARMEANSGYRSPSAVVRRLARTDLELLLAGGGNPSARAEPATLSLAITDRIVQRFGGDRAAAEKADLERVTAALGVQGRHLWPEAERRSFEAMSLLMALIPDLGRWPARDRRRVAAIMRAKGAPTEQRYLDLLRAHPRLREALLDVMARSSSQREGQARTAASS